VRLLHALFALDLPSLAPDYALAGETDAPNAATDTWTLVLTRRPESAAHYRELALSGDATRLSRIRLVRSERHITTIELDTPRILDAFSAEDLGRWFR
jgi:hypothetical protein